MLSSIRLRKSTAARLAVLALLGAALGGCASTVADLPMVGLPENTPARPAQPGEYLAVHDIPPPRPTRVMTPEEVAKAEQELIVARNRQAFGKGPAKPVRKPRNTAREPQDAAGRQN